MRYFKRTMDERGIATLVFDTPNSEVNVLRSEALYELEHEIIQMQGDKSIKALFIESAKEHIFIAGADINEIKALEEDTQSVEMLRRGHQILNMLEKLPFPTVAIIDGACLGGGLELALACDYRVATNDAHTRIGLVEVSLGLIPGLGGTQRLPLLVGFAKAIELITASKRLKGDKAFSLGLVDASVPRGYLDFKKEAFSKEILAGTLEAEIKKRRKGIRWYEIFAPVKILIAKMARREVMHKTAGHYPAPLKAIDVLEETLTMSLEEGLKVELEAFIPLAASEISKNLIELFFISESLKKETFSKAEPKTIESAAVIGVGTMGSGIAWLLAHNDISVRLGDSSMENIAAAMRKMMQSFERIKRRGRLNDREIGLKMDRVTYTVEMKGLTKTDIVIEAVSEDPVLKKKIYETLEAEVSDETIIATNTSSLAVSDLVTESQHPERFVGMHFFNPAPKMPLVEVIAGEKTNDETIATVVTLAKKLGKTPIKVAECAGFLVNRILLPYLNESVTMFEEGEDIERIDRLLTAFGMPMGPFTLADEVGIDIGEQVSHILHEAYGERITPSKVLSQMTANAWLGKKTGQGFYVHKGQNKSLNPRLGSMQSGDTLLEENIILDRAILIMVNEAALCLEEEVVDNARYLDMAMVMGTGFPAFRGGLLRYADAEGLENIVARLQRLEEEFGTRFKPNKTLVEMAKNTQTFYGGV